MSSKLPRIRSAKTIQVIVTETVEGEGETNDPMRKIYDYWDLDGKHLASFDEWQAQGTIGETK